MKLKKWADNNGMKYLTAYRKFKNGTLPVKASQSKTGAIIVEDDIKEDVAKLFNSEKDISFIISKVLEFNKNGSSIEDFAAYIISNFYIIEKEENVK